MAKTLHILTCHSGILLVTVLLSTGTVWPEIVRGNPQAGPQEINRLEKVLRKARAEGDRKSEAEVLIELGRINYNTGSLAKSLEMNQQALLLFRDLGDLKGQATALLEIGYIYSDLSELKKAVATFNKSSALWNETGDRHKQAEIQTAIATIALKTGDLQNAIVLSQEALDILKDGKDQISLGQTLAALGAVYNLSGEKEKALDYYNQALRIYQRNRKLRSVAVAPMLAGIGEIHRAQGNNQKALIYHQQALAILKRYPNSRTESYVQRYLGMIYESQAKQAKALACYTRALKLNRAGKDTREEAYTLNSLGHLHESSSNQQQAIAFYEQALKLSRATEDRSGAAATLYNLAHVERDRDKLESARARMEESLGIIESLRTQAASQELRASWFASLRQQYDLYIDVLLRQHQQQPDRGYDRLALEISERARARELLDLLTNVSNRISRNADPELIRRERELRQMIAGKADRRTLLLSQAATTDTIQLAETLAGQIRTLSREHEEVLAQIRLRNPGYAALTQPRLLDAQQIQALIPDDDTMLLEFALGDERSWLWAVTRTAITSHPLPGRVALEQIAQKVRDLLTARLRQPGENGHQYYSRIEAAETQWQPQAIQLSNMLLGPVAARLGNKRLLMVKEGTLQYLPFAALPEPEISDAEAREKANLPPNAAPQPLLTRHEIISLPSASVLAVLRDELKTRRSAPNELIVLADPVFEPDDPRIHSPSDNPQTSRRKRNNDYPVRGTDDQITLSRLPLTRQEAREIMELAPAATNRLALDFEASRALAVSDELSHYRIVHFATHGIVDTKKPERSGIVLSLFNEQGLPGNGFLPLADIYNLNLAADLVVLSACDTGLGRDIRGEGLIGLTRGFMYAGAARIVTSLWKVDDAATATLMKAFYRRMLRDSLSPAAALRSAQLELAKDPRWSSPFFWAAFVIQGEWNRPAASQNQR